MVEVLVIGIEEAVGSHNSLQECVVLAEEPNYLCVEEK